MYANSYQLMELGMKTGAVFIQLVPVKAGIKGWDAERALSHVSQPSEEPSRVCDSLAPSCRERERSSQAPNPCSRTRQQ